MNGNNKKGQIIHSLAWKFGERITAQVISLIVSIVLARLLSPEDYGAVALVMVFITIANVFVSSGLGSALIQKKDADNIDFSSVFFINIGLSIVLYFLIFFLAPYIALFFDLPILSPALRVLGLRIVVAAINSIQHAYVSKHMLFKRFFWSTLFGTVLSGVVGVWMAYAGFGVWALIAQYLTNTCTDTIVLWFTVRWRPQLKCSWLRAKGLISYGWKILVSALLDTGYSQLRNLLVGKIYTKEDLAFYNQGDKLPSIITVNINSSIGSVLFPALSKDQDDSYRVKSMTRRAIQVSSYIMWPLMIGLGVCAEPLIRFIYTEKWLPCVPYLQVFCFSYGLWPIHTSNIQAIIALGRSDIYLKLEIIKKILGLTLLLVTLPFGPFAIAMGLAVSGVISTYINAAPNKRLLNYSYKEQLVDIVPSMIMALIMGLCIYPMVFLHLPDIITLLIQLILGVSIYGLLSKLTKNKTFTYLFSGFISRIKNKRKG